jgi:hypothetical protein
MSAAFTCTCVHSEHVQQLAAQLRVLDTRAYECCTASQQARTRRGMQHSRNTALIVLTTHPDNTYTSRSEGANVIAQLFALTHLKKRSTHERAAVSIDTPERSHDRRRRVGSDCTPCSASQQALLGWPARISNETCKDDTIVCTCKCVTLQCCIAHHSMHARARRSPARLSHRHSQQSSGCSQITCERKIRGLTEGDVLNAWFAIDYMIASEVGSKDAYCLHAMSARRWRPCAQLTQTGKGFVRQIHMRRIRSGAHMCPCTFSRGRRCVSVRMCE